MRVKQLGSVIFTYNSLFVEEDEKPNTVLSEVRMSGAGTHIVWEAPINTPYLTLNSKENSWVTKDQKNALMAMWDSLGATYSVIYDDDNTDTVRFAREKIARFQFVPLYEGSTLYRATIPLAKI